MSSRERWNVLVDVRHATGQVLTAVSHALEVDLCGSVLPRHEAVDDRVVPTGRRNYLAPSDVRSLPLGVWVEAGPYTKSEWLARGVAGAAGTAAFLRVNERSYLAAYETRTGSMWRLETTGRGAHHGLVAEGTADTLTVAKDSARQAMVERFPDVARAVDAGVGAGVVSPHVGWVPVAGGREGRAEQRTLDERVAAMISSGPGGRWQTWTVVDRRNQQGPLVASAVEARQVADSLAHGALMQLAAISPDRANAMIRDAAASADGWSRATLDAVIGHRLTDVDRRSLTEATTADVLTGHMVDSGVLSPRTMLAVLHCEGFDLDSVVPITPMLGLSTPDAIRELHEGWGANRLQVGEALGASTEELRTAGCTAVEMLAAAPREELRRLDSREDTWLLAGAALVDAGYSRSEAVGHLAAHAPTPETFAAAVSTIVDDPVEAFVYSARRAATEDLVALSERYNLSPEQTARALTLSCTPRGVAVEVISERCDHDVGETIELATEYLGLGTEIVHRLLTEPDVEPSGSAVGLDLSSVESLLATLGPADPTGHLGVDSSSLVIALAAAARSADLTMEIS